MTHQANLFVWCFAITMVARTTASALAKARALEAPDASKTMGGEYEGADFWEEHDKLLRAAWQEYGQKHPELYVFDRSFEQKFITPQLREAVEEAASQASSDSRSSEIEYGLRTLLTQPVPGAFRMDIFTEQFRTMFKQEIDHLGASGIPQRRPNGMNRFGSILDDLGLDLMVEGLVHKYLKPLVLMMFPADISAEDIKEHYAFVVRYKKGEDLSLDSHRDASVATMNLCLGEEGFTGGELSFWGDGDPGGGMPRYSQDAHMTRHQLDWTSGDAILHKGQHKHEALPLTGGTRINLIVWMFGHGGTVRIAPYETAEQLTAAQRWGAGYSGAQYAGKREL